MGVTTAVVAAIGSAAGVPGRDATESDSKPESYASDDAFDTGD
jgi:hypothetical protein